MTISRVPATPIYPTPPSAPAARGSAPVAASSASALAPATKPSPLWNVLTAEERAFFLSTAALGSLGYGPSGAVTREVDAPIGQRLDVRA
ncbi:MAG: hypothetical protein IPJ11_03510 [Gemmatimonadetes bacterium]|nr:hypothetical protein [Gemmatimonadota bacterium]